ncbi:peptide-N-glycosidase F-related protein [Bacteroidia bacterium]|nr:peptide-N-glycosidase F-related protein [Bacteroidia bacterium]
MMLKKTFTVLLSFIGFLGAAVAADGDTTEIITHQDILIQTNPSKGRTDYYGWGAFPKEGSFQRMYAELSFECPDGLRCGEWDYLNYIYLRTRKGDHNDTLNWEIMRFITPYGFSFNSRWKHTWRFDITDFESLFRDSVEIQYRHTGYEAKNDRGWIINLKFVMIEGKPDREVLNISRMYQKSVPFGDVAKFRDNTPEFTWTPTKGTKTSRIKIIQTGHGMDQPSNCAEFCPRNRFLYMDGNCFDTSLVWRADCGENPVYPQAGTWIYDRSGWCPGQNVLEYNVDLTEDGSELRDIVHTFDLDMEAYTKTSGNSNYVITAYLVEYGDIKKGQDASIIDIIQPSTHSQHLRRNPICSEPTILVKNNGKSPLFSIDIDYGVKGGKKSSHHWVGKLRFGETTEIRLPYKMDWTPVSNQFEASIVKTNGVKDWDPSNNTLAVEMPEPPKLMTDKIVVFFRSNNAPMENSWKILDAGGHVYKERKSFPTANTLYRDTVELYNGCFTFILDDRGTPNPAYPLNEDGIGWWGNTTDGNGSIQLRSVTGSILAAFNPDFGSEVRTEFTVGYALNQDNLGSRPSQMKVFPNPATDGFMVDLPERFVKSTNPSSLEVFTLEGRKVYEERFSRLSSSAIWINSESLKAGAYIVKFRQNNDLCTSKVLLK